MKPARTSQNCPESHYLQRFLITDAVPLIMSEPDFGDIYAERPILARLLLSW